MVAPNDDPRPQSPSRLLSRQKLRANRRNAKQSTGPRSAEGKERSARNAVTHGLYAAAAAASAAGVPLPGEDRRLFEQLRLDCIRRLRPQDLLELSLVDRIVAAQWKLNRAEAGENQGDPGEDTQGRRPSLVRQLMLDDLKSLGLRGTPGKPANLFRSAMRMLGDVPEKHCFDRALRYARALQQEISRCLRDLERVRRMDETIVDLPESPFLNEAEERAEAPPVENGEREKCENKPTAAETPASAVRAGGCDEGSRQNEEGEAPQYAAEASADDSDASPAVGTDRLDLS